MQAKYAVLTPDSQSNRASDEVLAADLRDMTLLYEVGNCCTREGNDLDRCLQKIIDTAIAVTHTDKATLQLYDEELDALIIMAHRGFGKRFLTFFGRVQHDTPAVSREAQKAGERVIIEDLTKSRIFAGTRSLELLLDSGVRAAQSTPLIGAGGGFCGMISTHFSKPHRPAERELRLMDLLARQTADYLERRRSNEESSRLMAIIDHSDDAIVSKDLQGIIRSWNKGAERLFGYAPEEAIGQPVTILIPADRTDEEPDILNRIRRGERIDHYETVRRRKDGTLIEIALTVSPVKDRTGRIVGASKIVHDITARKRIQGQQALLYDLVAAINGKSSLPEICRMAVKTIRRSQGADRAAILLYDGDNVMRFNSWLGLSDEYRSAVEGHSPWKQYEADPQPVCIDDVATTSLDEHLRRVIEREGIRAMAFIPLAHQGRLLGKFMIYYDAPHRFTPEELRPAQTISSQIVFAIDRQTSGEALEALVNERTASLREVIAQMEEFSYTVSHDLRAPLRAIHGHSEAVCRLFGASLSTEANYSLQRIISNSRLMDKMVTDLLTFSRVARAESRLERIDAQKLVLQIAEQYPGMQAPEADIQIGALPRVMGHEPSLIQVFSNLLTNAVKFVPPNTRPRVRVWGERNDGHVRVWVSDNGIGVEPKYQHRLFKMFERIHPNLKQEGTGVGLAIVRKAAERMGGKVGMESDGANGSRFWIELRAGEEENESEQSNNSVG